MGIKIYIYQDMIYQLLAYYQARTPELTKNSDLRALTTLG